MTNVTTLEMMETMESLRALWRDGPSRPAHDERPSGRHAPDGCDWRLLRELEQSLQAETARSEGPEQRRFAEWLERLGYGEESRWCCPVEETFGAGWRAGYADGVQAAVRLLHAARDPAEAPESLRTVGQGTWAFPEESDSDGTMPPPVPLNRARRR
jgi:hypothetical protein